MSKIKPVYKGFLNKNEAEDIFNSESVYLDSRNVVPCYRVTEIFGEWTEEFTNTQLTSGSDCNAWGNCGERPLIYYLHKSGFMKIVSERNYQLMVKEIQEKGISGQLCCKKKGGVGNE